MLLKLFTGSHLPAGTCWILLIEVLIPSLIFPEPILTCGFVVVGGHSREDNVVYVSDVKDQYNYYMFMT